MELGCAQQRYKNTQIASQSGRLVSCWIPGSSEKKQGPIMVSSINRIDFILVNELHGLDESDRFHQLDGLDELEELRGPSNSASRSKSS